jgi:hypothetical protein
MEVPMKWKSLVLVGSAQFALTGAAVAGNGMTVEATDNYTAFSGCPGPSLAHNVQNVEGLYNNMTTTGGVSWTKYIEWNNASVWDRDMQDPEKVGNGAEDNNNMDQSTIALSMFSGHGSCGEWTGQSCTTAANCTSPAFGQASPGHCYKNPGSSSGVCAYFAPRYAITCGDSDSFGHFANLSNGGAAFGESTSSGSWGGAGTNGNVNMLVMDVSCGGTPGQEVNEYWNAFAGAHIISTVEPSASGSDTLDVSTRGSSLAAQFRANPNSSASISWLSAMNSVSGGSCASGSGHGISGCGAYISYSLAESQSWAEFLNGTESWSSLQNDGNDAFGAVYMAWVYQCNFNCNQYPLYY